MKKFIMSSLLSLMLSTSLFAYENCYEEPCCPQENNLYVNVYSGANFLDTNHFKEDYHHQVGYVVSASLGYHFNYGFRVEGEYAFRRNSLRLRHEASDSSRLESFQRHSYFQTSSYMANVLWDIPLRRNCLGVDPFIGAGIGYDRQGTQHSSDSKHITTTTRGQFAWQLMAGVSYPLFQNTTISLGYKLHKGEANDIYNHSIGLGLTYNFGARVEFWN